ncbi:RhuM family protein [uncultured Algoriphagus sp.]|uniref:RhuM family protein n=1 Tax=uncultured Algoriphagus sp. TaxID=417365 RepID=UPI0030EE6711
MENKIKIPQSPNSETQFEVRFEDNTIWLTNSQLVELFKSSKANISEHIKNIFESKELEKDLTVRDFRTVQMEGKRAVERDRVHYNLDVITALGYRVNSKRGRKLRP